MEYGLWDQIRVDHGKEWCLMLYINGTLSHLRGKYIKITSFTDFLNKGTYNNITKSK